MIRKAHWLVWVIAVVTLCLVGMPKNATAQSMMCNICNWYVGELGKMVTPQSTPEQVQAAMQRVSPDVLPSFLRDPAKEFQSQYSRQIYDLILGKRVSLGEICSTMNVCSQ